MCDRRHLSIRETHRRKGYFDVSSLEIGRERPGGEPTIDDLADTGGEGNSDNTERGLESAVLGRRGELRRDCLFLKRSSFVFIRLRDTDRDKGLLGDLGSVGASSPSASTVRLLRGAGNVLDEVFDLASEREAACCIANVALLSATDLRLVGTMAPGCEGSPTRIPPGGDRLGLRLKGALSAGGLMAIAVIGEAVSATGDTAMS